LFGIVFSYIKKKKDMKKNIFTIFATITVMFFTLSFSLNNDSVEDIQTTIIYNVDTINIKDMIKEECTVNDVPEALRDIIWY
jgi:hypothetical protein